MPAARAGPSNATGQSEERTIKRIRAGESTQSPLKIVKRLCLGPNSGIGLQWDKVESPVKRIVTRSAAADDLVALSEEEDEAISEDGEEEVEGTVIEYLNEQGEKLQQNAEAEDDGWSDVDAPASDADKPRNNTTTRFGEVVEDASLGQYDLRADESETTTQTIGSNEKNATVQDPGTALGTESTSDATLPSLGPATQSMPLPAGFVSPVRRKRTAARRLSVLAGETGRRRTLPRTFAVNAGAANETVHAPSSEAQHAEAPTDPTNDSAVTKTSAIDDPQQLFEDQDMIVEDKSQASDDNEWEDMANGAEAEEHDSSSAKDMDGVVAVDDQAGLQEQPLSPVSQSSFHQLDLPLRRSPRRKSSSPMKQRAFQTFNDAAPHLVAFSPVKSMVRGSDESSQQIDVDETDCIRSFVDGSPIMLERSSSAPPEEPQMSPRRSAKPRVSDDTALLQAFLNRAAENKSTRRLSATKRESLSNRRDSDTVRQALASPLKPEILGTLDPNSPSPKKSAPTPEEVKSVNTEIAPVSSPVEGGNEPENTQGRTTRRSHREKRRVERAAPLAQTRISLRGNTEPVVLKRSEAQELATVTRSNTRKNKGGSIMPTLRLSKLIVEKPPIEGSPDVETERTGTDSSRAGRRNVQWDETLVYYQDAPSEPEVQLFELGDSNTAPKLQSTPQASATEAEEDETVPAPPPAAETPSKPKSRRLRTPRTASTPAKPALAPTAAEHQEPADALPPLSKQKQPRRSRIATPAKGLDNTSLLPADVAPVEQPAPAAKPKALPRKKAASRLPAPATLSAASQEPQSLISSPPKKKASSGMPPVKNFAPKLDFQTNLGASSKSTDHASEGLGLASPAKRAGKISFFGAAPAAPSFGQKTEPTGKPPGLSSPAKKRTRRAL